VIRGEDMKVRTFYNICPHRGNTLLAHGAAGLRSIPYEGIEAAA
jgi:phenylpropionate dioxygenase-like ring-hydroxylating dioxygenase large terminal subunit